MYFVFATRPPQSIIIHNLEVGLTFHINYLDVAILKKASYQLHFCVTYKIKKKILNCLRKKPTGNIELYQNHTEMHYYKVFP